MTNHASPKNRSRATAAAVATAAIPAVVVSSFALAQPAQAPAPQSQPTVKRLPQGLEAAIAGRSSAALLPAAQVATALPSAMRIALTAVPDSYRIVSGDTMSGIAGRYGLSLSALLRLNGMRETQIIYPGQVIRLKAAPSTSAPATSPAAPQQGGSVYTVKSGDTLGAIAMRHGVSLGSLLSWNGLQMTSIIYPGQKVKVSAPGAVVPQSSGTTTPTAPSAPSTAGGYLIKAGDTLGAIAARHNVSLGSLLDANKLKISSIIYPGQRLAIPGAAQSGGSEAPGGLVPDSFLGYTYPKAVVDSANRNKALLNAAPVPTRAEMKQIVADTARRMGVEPALAMAFAYQESGFNQRAVSPANAIGTMQVIPSSGEWASQLVGRKLNLLDPYDNATAGIAIIRSLLQTSRNMDYAIAGYYQGQYSVDKYGMYKDTKAYVAAIKAHRATFL
ncbi:MULTISPECIES: lytic transglycosylase domain-containing protein [Arthrobacter]|uniref:LysM peptidoglycan-binding domain-containing protein n=2 Tax=Arthrobacter TaxID=1663 RepID=A0ABU9KIL1_9MICC|nr:lytic transglycosylase domain-containing protein [Arthrobacter sp. YJM1]MDP5226217.1 LysM peptidoglycan-binding domain-containing protein [Arthrobacter sp. YJM1]